MAVTGRNTYAGMAVLIVHQPDGTLAHVPEWMARPEAAALGLFSPPRLPLRCLNDLRSIVDATLSSLCSSSACGGGDGRTATPTATREATGSVSTGATGSGAERDDTGEVAGAAHKPAGGDHTGRRRAP
jgi:hypothetical protein